MSSPGPFERLPTRLRPGLSSFVGRARDVASVTASLEADARLVTLTGAVGIGKTRLALEVAAAWGRGRPVAFVEVDDAVEVPALCRAVSDALGWPLARPAAEQVEELAEAFAALDPDTLVVLDGVTPTLARALGRWGEASRGRFLGTGIRRLKLAFERAHRLAPLAYPRGPVEDPRAFDAVRLFEDRARAARAQYRLDEDAVAVAAICERLDGIPRRIELAATRMSTLSAEQLLERLAAAERTETLSWALELASPAERAALGRCAVFRGGFSLEAAEAVLGGEYATDALHRLSDACLVEVAFPEDERTPRFRVLGDLRARLADPGPEVAARHARHYREVARAALADLEGPSAREAARALFRERDNVVAAGRALGDAGCWLAASAVSALRGTAEDALELGRQGLECAAPEVGARLHVIRARVLARLARLPESGAEADAALRSAVDPITRASAHVWRAYAHHRAGRLADARACLAEGRAAVDDPIARAELGGWAMLGCARPADAVEATRAAVRDLRALGQPRRLQTACRNLGVLEASAGDVVAAADAFAEALALARDLDDPIARAVAELYLGMLASRAQAHAEASAHYDRGLSSVRHRAYGAVDAAALALRAASAVAEGQDEVARERLARGRRVARGDDDRTQLLLALAAALVELDHASELRERVVTARRAARSTPLPERDAFTAIVDAIERLSRGHAVGAPPAAVAMPESAALLGVLHTLGRTRAPDDRASLVVGPSGFRVDDEPLVDLSRRGAMRRVLLELARRAVTPEPSRATTEELFAAGWPDERALPEAAARRVYTCLWSLRKLGLSALIDRDERGYALAPGARVRLTESPLDDL